MKKVRSQQKVSSAFNSLKLVNCPKIAGVQFTFQKTSQKKKHKESNMEFSVTSQCHLC